MLWRQRTRERVLCYGGENFVVLLHKLLVGSTLKTKYFPATPLSGDVPYVPLMNRNTESKPERRRVSG